MSNTLPQHLRTVSFDPKDELHFSISYLAELADKPIEYVMDEAFIVLPEHGYDSLFNHSVKNDNGDVTDLFLSYKDSCVLLLEVLSSGKAVIAITRLSAHWFENLFSEHTNR